MATTDSSSALRDILKLLPPNTKHYPYNGLQDFWSHVAAEQNRFLDDETGNTSQYMLFTNIRNNTFTRDFDIVKHKSSWHLVDSYYIPAEILLIKMSTSKHHERVHIELSNLMNLKLCKMNGANLGLDSTGSAIIPGPTRKKKADQEFAPLNLPPGRASTWPTMVMEAGYSESKSKLQSDAEWWIKESKGDVKAAITISLHRTKPEIVFHKWEPVDTGRTNTRIQISATRSLQLVVSRPHGQPEVEADVTNGPLTVSFQDLFLRPPNRDEQDIEFTDDDLRQIAKKVWMKQGF